MSERVSRGLCDLEVRDRRDRQGLADWVIGSAFAFHTWGKAITFLGAPDHPTLGEPINPVTIHPHPIVLPELVSVFTDKDLYREGRDTVRFVVFAPGSAKDLDQVMGPPKGTARLELKLNGQALTTIDVALGTSGLGLYEYPEPIAGEYEASVGASTTRFTVAEYKLAPLTARFDGFSLVKDTKPERLKFAAILESYGVPFTGAVNLELLDLASAPGVVRQKLTLTAGPKGRIEGDVLLNGDGPFALALAALEDPAKTATLPVPGSRATERSELELSRWGTRRVARLMPFAECAEIRGLYVGEEPAPNAEAPLSIVSVDHERVRVRLEAKALSVCFVAYDPSTRRFEQVTRGHTFAGTELEVPLHGPWTLLFAGVNFLGQYFEGRAAIPRPVAPALDLRDLDRSEPLSIAVKDEAEPGETVSLQIRGLPGGTAFVLVKDERLQVSNTPVSSTAASLRRQIEAGLQVLTEGKVTATLTDVLEPARPPPPVMFAAMPDFGNIPLPAAAPRGGFAMPVAMPRMAMPRPGAMMAQAVRSKVAAVAEAFEDADLSEGAPGEAGPAEPAARTEFPEVVLARLVELDREGKAKVDVKLGQAMGSMKVEVFAAAGFDWAYAERTLLVTREVFGELVLPRFVRAGDPAEGRLYVRVAEGAAKVKVLRDGKQVILRGAAGEAEEIDVEAPGATIAFDAGPGKYGAEVRGAALVDKSEGKVEEPGKLVWLQKAIRMLSPGESVTLDEPGALQLELLPSLDAVFDKMVGGLRSYEHACCEQTSAVLLAAAAAYATAKDEDVRRAAETHIRGCVEREKRMYLKGRGFKGWPNYPDEVFVYSPGATLNLLQIDLLKAQKLSPALAKSVDECLEMARDAAKAHKIDPAPERPTCAREAYGRFSKFLDDRQKMAAFIRERVEPWQKELKAILKFEVPAMSTETYHKSPAMIRAESAFGAATLLEMGGEHQKEGLSLANTVLGAIREDGSMYSTLDSVAALTLLGALQKAKVVSGPNAKVRVDGQETTYGEAVDRKGIRSVEAVDSPVQVQITRVVEEDYTAIDKGVKAKVELRRGGKAVTTVKPGDTLELSVEVTSGYEAGDLLHVFLPDCLSWVHGGGQVKKFSLDFKGQAKLQVPLAVTGATFGPDGAPAPQHFAVAVRNMYDEERGKGFGDLAVTVDPQGGGDGLAQKVLRGLKSLLQH